MCLIAWNWQPGTSTPLLLLANRDEFYARPALPLHWWEPHIDGTQVLAGKDLRSDGTWLGLSRTGRLAALTNFRSAEPQRSNTPSRGELVAGFLHSNLSSHGYLQQLALRCGDYNPFNLLVFDGDQLMGLESRSAKVVNQAPGLGAVSNANFHTPWPKLTQLQAGLEAHAGMENIENLQQFIPLLHNRKRVTDAALPRTGVALARERALSAIFIATPDYGTRACSVVALRQNRAEFLEQSYGPAGLFAETQLQFSL
jgi:uncharacterized protein with NRDE domain